MRINKSLITYIPSSGAGSGTVTSVAMTVPSGVFTILGSPITSSGTLQVGLVNQLANTVWAGPSAGSESAPTFRALVEADIPNLSASKITSGTLGVAIGGTGATSLSGVLIGNGTSAFSTASSVTSGQLLRVNTLGTGYEFFTPSFIVSTDIIATSPLVWNSGTNTMSIPAASNVADGYLTSADWLTFSSKQPAITLTTTGNSGASTLVGATLNVPEYTLAGLGGMANVFTTIGDIVYSNAIGVPTRRAGNTTTTKMFLSSTGDGTTANAPIWEAITTSTLGAVPTSRTLTINGTTFDLSADRTFSVGTVTSVAVSVPTGLSVSGSPITSSGTIAISLQSGYSIPTTAKQTEWDSAYTNRITNLTTTGNSGAATLIANTLNVPEYTLAGLGGMTNPMTSLGDMIYGNAVGAPLRIAPNTTTTKKYLSMTGDGTSGDQPFWDTITASGLGAVPTSRTLTINGTSFDLSADRSWTVGGVTSVGLSSTTSGVTIGSTPITTSGTITIDIAIASSTTDGLLSSTDWAYFDDKMGNPFTSLGDILYSNAIGIGLRRAGNTTTTKMFLSQTGDGTNSAAPQWSVVTASDTGAVPTSRTITINDVVYDLSANRSWDVGDYGTW